MFPNDVDVRLLITFRMVEYPGLNLDDRGIEVQLLTRAQFVFFYPMSRPAVWVKLLSVKGH
jgi:hypothetical protein